MTDLTKIIASAVGGRGLGGAVPTSEQNGLEGGGFQIHRDKPKPPEPKAPTGKRNLTFVLRATGHIKGIEESECAQLKADGKIDGACDAMFVMFMSYLDGGGVSGHVMGVDGRRCTEDGAAIPMKDADKFRVWGLLTDGLANSTTLDPQQLQVVRKALETIHSYIQLQADMKATMAGAFDA